MQLDYFQQNAQKVLPEIPQDGMLYYLQVESLLRGRVHENTFFMTFKGGEKEVFRFFQEMTFNVVNRLLVMQSWEVQCIGYWFVKLFPLPYVIMPIPYPLFGYWPEPAAPSKHLAIVSAKTAEQGRRSWGRKLLFGMPATWTSGERLTGEGWERINSHTQTWEQLFAGETGESDYTMGMCHRYIDGSYRSPLNPLNYVPYERFMTRPYLIKHRHPKRSKRWPI